MSLQTLPFLFDEMFQGEFDFEHFLNFPTQEEIVHRVINKKLTCIASPTLRAYHRFIQRYVIRHLKVKSEVVFSYRKEVNVVDALRKHSKNKCFYQTDLSDFFPSIKKDLVARIFSMNEDNMPFLDFDKYAGRIVDLITFNSRVPRGFVTSNPLSNACLVEFDNSFLKYCQENDIVYTRYSDDIVISGVSDEKVKAASLILMKLLGEIYGGAFLVNAEKSKFVKLGRKIKLLGMVILPNGAVSIDLPVKRKIETLLHFYVTNTFKFLDLVDDDFEKGRQSLAGYINFANAADKVFLAKLRRRYGEGAVDALLHMG